MTQFWTPWQGRPKPEYKGASGVVAGIARSIYSVAAPLVRWRWFAFPFFCFAVAVSILAVYVIGVLNERYISEYAILRDILIVIGTACFIGFTPVLFIWMERKIAGRMQSRCGLMRVGGWHGWAQSPADGIKCVSKEDLVPADADGILYRLAPYFALTPVVVAFVALPFGGYWVFRKCEVGLIFVLAMLGVEVVAVIMAGWASASKWTLFGAIREACQMVSYEIPMGLAVLLPVMTVGTLNLTAIGNEQAGGWPSWLVFRSPFLFFAALIYYITSLASCKRAPFDLPEGESELVGGFHTEYSGFRWALFFFAEYTAMFLVSALSTIMFFGAWNSPLPLSWGEALGDGYIARAIRGVLFSGPLWFIFKAYVLMFVQLWLRWTLPRIRIDQVLYAGVQVMLPAMLVLLLGHMFWELWFPPETIIWKVVNVLLALVGALIVFAAAWVSLRGFMQGRRLVGYLAVDLLPGS